MFFDSDCKALLNNSICNDVNVIEKTGFDINEIRNSFYESGPCLLTEGHNNDPISPRGGSRIER